MPKLIVDITYSKQVTVEVDDDTFTAAKAVRHIHCDEARDLILLKAAEVASPLPYEWVATYVFDEHNNEIFDL